MSYVRQRNPRFLRALFQIVCMVDAEFLVFFLILEYLVQLTDPLEGRLRHGLVIWTQPDQHVACIFVDVVHELDLLASLRYIGLVYTDLVGPETPWSIQLSKPSQSIVEAGSEPNALAVADDLVAAVRLAPHVREWLVIFRGGNVEEFKITRQWI